MLYSTLKTESLLVQTMVAAVSVAVTLVNTGAGQAGGAVTVIV